MSRRVLAILAQRCPVCLQGPMFRSTFTMNETCNVCGHKFMREQGFFQGAMYVSYVLGLVVFLALSLSADYFLAPRWGLVIALGVAVALQMLLVPRMYRLARVIWAHVNVRTQP